MSLLIISHAFDEHGICVAAALAKRGRRVVIWPQPQIAGTQLASVSLGKSGTYFSIESRSYRSNFFDAVWMRRHSQISLPEWVVQEDSTFAEQENRSFFRSIWSALDAETKWIHSISNYQRAETKVQQLRTALDVKFKIPETLVSNAPQEIEDFVGSLEYGDGAIYKTFYPMAWDEPGVVKPMYTASVKASDFTNHRVISAVPGIYQRKVNKLYEVRSTFFGKEDRTIKIDSQRSAQGELDWRNISVVSEYASPHRLPEDVKLKCLAYMEIFQIEIACFDFIVDERGDYVFLEANQQGQFLWVEMILPEIRMLDVASDFFCAHLAGSSLQAECSKTSLHDLVREELYVKIKEDLKTNRFVDTQDYKELI
ncbi:hypothetical protein SAMN05428989_1467 [Pseudoxanthomonas sp. GM95]|uniref:MvdC/MvdD family ATP grasp protein n=1 Tax=Pseudoxanthomonas sp. GM95 TaxID=1881043 RepID=UPI0008AF1DC3|nr:hypothetical protein [Pseudoxanthomonas sp. GM95]SEL11274.1 hypothetical protein SAMN05428989_1467 [Pseudoxanthomonas sp. GM95]